MVLIPKKQLKNGFSMPVIGLGTWGMGGWVEKDTSHDESDRKAIRRALDAGINHIDTAERYAEGHAEELVGEVISERERSSVFLVSKVIPEHLSYDDLLHAAENSLRRLRTNYLDLYLIHNPNPAIPITETMRAMDRLVDEGLIRHIGVSTFTVPQFEEAQSAARHPIVANQLHFNLAYRAPEKQGLLDHAKTHDWMFVAFRPIRDVLLLEKKPEILHAMCAKYGKTSAQIAVNWLLQQENVVTIAKCGTKEHLDDVLGALQWKLEEADVHRLRMEFPLPSSLPRPPAPAL
ncbi:MAG: hypothetical protein A2756_05525 [Candidatus Ryanbacteria bacterium RIFCSPHIGHO2_01_FULL_48_27]|uniref:NADP-dependent oxidoreductase domain-containing protein n=1 Tax=Candidatus Ryanbacteria bacterium RIFCSPHIGHO2_01_FULL_48_27 TaxID=1802115 RepID=A0A1G2G206_9BACT|nr:MAG: hypothetical protein A2756_05525 [Candidatus Ryanbacteria bacterium RIFCSPHIGHO2_01_FULL_48_27]